MHYLIPCHNTHALFRFSRAPAKRHARHSPLAASDQPYTDRVSFLFRSRHLDRKNSEITINDTIDRFKSLKNCKEEDNSSINWRYSRSVRESSFTCTRCQKRTLRKRSHIIYARREMRRSISKRVDVLAGSVLR